MGQFSQLLFNNVRGMDVASAVKSSTPIAKLREAADRACMYLDNQSSKMTDLLGSLTQDSSIISDYFSERSDFSMNTSATALVSWDTYVSVLAAFKEVAPDGMTIVHTNGKPIKIQYMNVSGTGYDTIVANSTLLFHPNVVGTNAMVDNIIKQQSSTEENWATSLYDVIQGQMESSAMNDALRDVLRSCLVTTSDAITGVYSTVAEIASSKWESVRSFCKHVRTALQTGGLYGAVSFILSWFKNITTITGTDGTLAFTDNAALIPAQYIAGVVGQLFATAAALVGFLVMSFSRILGAAIALVGLVATAITKAVSYDVNQTYSSINDDLKTLSGVCPHACMQYESSTITAALTNFFASGGTAGRFEIPGATVFFGPGSFNADGSVASVRYELHPVLAEYDMFLNYLYSAFVVDVTQEAGEDEVYTIRWTGDDITASTFVEKFNRWVTAFDLENDAETGVSDPTLDAAIRRNLAAATAISLVYLRMLENSTGLEALLHGQHPQPRSTPGYLPGRIFDPKWYESSSGVVVEHTSLWQVALAGLFVGSDFEDIIVTQITGWSYALNVGSWSDIGVTFTHCASFGPSTYLALLRERGYFGDPLQLPSDFRYALNTPKYDSASFVKWIVIALVAATVVATAAVITSVAVKRAIQRRQAINQARVESAWSDFSSNPSSATYSAYRKTVKRNNMWAGLIGGTKYDYVNYWNGDTADASSTGLSSSAIFLQDADPSDNDVVANSVGSAIQSDIAALDFATPQQVSNVQQAVSQLNPATPSDVDVIVRLIRGPSN